MTKELLRVEEAAGLLAVSPRTVRLWLAQRRLPRGSLGRCVRIPRAGVEEIISRNTVPARASHRAASLPPSA